MEGIIVKIISTRYEVVANNERYLCIARGKLRKNMAPCVGDRVIFEQFDDTYGIEKILPRTNMLIRPYVANVDQAIIVMSCVEPEFSKTLVDRLIYFINYYGINASLIISKVDLLDDLTNIEKIKQIYKDSGINVCYSNDIDGIKDIIDGKISVLTGQSGVGKSTMLNLLDSNLNLPTQKISKALNRGKHTTRFSCLYPIYNGYIVDTPGFSSLEFYDLDIRKFVDSIMEYQKYHGSCKYNDCIHENEPDCAVKNAVIKNEINEERYNNYLECLKMIRDKRR
ncbi:MAG: ribosome small subunit-dependent GTPase A [Erysipelotrichaceae bacterium]